MTQTIRKSRSVYTHTVPLKSTFKLPVTNYRSNSMNSTPCMTRESCCINNDTLLDNLVKFSCKSQALILTVFHRLARRVSSLDTRLLSLETRLSFLETRLLSRETRVAFRERVVSYFGAVLYAF